MSPQEAILRLMFVDGLGPARYWKLLQHFASPTRLLKREYLASALPVNEVRCWPDDPRCDAYVDRVEHWCRETGGCLLSHLDTGYPPLLRELAVAPPLLFVLGNPAALLRPQLAIVGSRRATKPGLKQAHDIAADLAERGLAITSGLALGIDAQAHRGALAVGGLTVAVIGSGLDCIYPRSNARLAEQIVATGGCVVSEFPLGTVASAQNFPRRNRIISGLSLGTLVVEAALKSGSLITARYALEQNREVFAMPGAIHNPLARGCHALLREGAVLVEGCDDVLRELHAFQAAPPSSPISPTPSPPLQGVEARVYAALHHQPQHIDEVVEACGVEVAEVLSALIALELAGWVICEAAGYSHAP